MTAMDMHPRTRSQARAAFEVCRAPLGPAMAALLAALALSASALAAEREVMEAVTEAAMALDGGGWKLILTDSGGERALCAALEPPAA